MYWAKKDDGLTWPSDFDGSNIIGGSITPHEGLPIGILAPNEHKSISYNWNKNIPDAETIESDEIVLLARISDKHIGRFGLSMDQQGNSETFDTLGNLNSNIANFNGIAATTFTLGEGVLNDKPQYAPGNSQVMRIHNPTISINENSNSVLRNSQDFATTDNLNLYPNPLIQGSPIYIKGRITRDINYEIYNLQGKLIFKGKVDNNQIETKNLNFESGLFMVVLKDEHKSRLLKSQIIYFE